METPEINEFKDQPLNFEYVSLTLINYFSHHTFYAYLLQGIIILYAYVRGVGRNGKFWKVIYIGTLASFIGAVVSNTCKIIIDKQVSDGEEPNIILFYILIINETLYAIRNLVLPYINVIKVMPLLEEKEKKRLKIFIGIMTVVHFCLRYNVALWRLKHKDTEMSDVGVIRAYGYAAISIAFTDIVCSMIIIKKLIENYHIAARKNLKISVYKYFFQSALFTLIFVDFFSLIIGILAVADSPILKITFVPLVGLNSNIILILAFDALIFKNDVILDMNSSYNCSYFSNEKRSNDMIPCNSTDQYQRHYHQNHNDSQQQYVSHLSNYYNSQSYFQSNYYSENNSEGNSHCYSNSSSNQSKHRSYTITISDQLENTNDYVSQKD